MSRQFFDLSRWIGQFWSDGSIVIQGMDKSKVGYVSEDSERGLTPTSAKKISLL